MVARISLQFTLLSQQSIQPPNSPRKLNSAPEPVPGLCQLLSTVTISVATQFETSNPCVSRVESPEWSWSVTSFFMLLHCISRLLKLHPSNTGQKAEDSCCILFVPYFQSGSCLKPQNHSISLLEICNSDQQGSVACLRPIKYEAGRMPPTELISSIFSTPKPTYWLQQEPQICTAVQICTYVQILNLQSLEIRNKSLYPAPEIEFCGGARNQPACSHPWSVWVTEQPAVPFSSSRDQFLFR